LNECVTPKDLAGSRRKPCGKPTHSSSKVFRNEEQVAENSLPFEVLWDQRFLPSSSKAFRNEEQMDENSLTFEVFWDQRFLPSSSKVFRNEEQADENSLPFEVFWDATDIILGKKT